MIDCTVFRTFSLQLIHALSSRLFIAKLMKSSDKPDSLESNLSDSILIVPSLHTTL